MIEPNDDIIESIIECGVGELYRGFFRLRQAGEYQREYDTMGAVIDMLMKDRQHLRTTYKVNV